MAPEPVLGTSPTPRAHAKISALPDRAQCAASFSRLLWTAVRAMVVPEASEWRRQVMTDKVAEARYSVSDVVAVAIYSVLVLLLMLAWAYVPA